jgi:hypothetical protein
MRRFKSQRQVQRFRAVHWAVYNLFNMGRDLRPLVIIGNFVSVP